MKKLTFMNEGVEPLKEAIQGMVKTRTDIKVIDHTYNHICVKTRLTENRVRVLINGGGGRGPFFEGCVGEGLADAAISGDFNCAPNAYVIYQVAKEISSEKGVLLLTNNFMGDYLNNDMARELLEADGIPVKVVYISDDICSARGESKESRGGLCGIGLVMKVAASAANAGKDLEEVSRIADKANARIRTLSFVHNEKENTIEFGNGFSGEAAVESIPFISADEVAKRAVAIIMSELDKYSEGRMHVLVNRMLYMSYVEGYLILHSVQKALEARQRKIGNCTAGNYFDAFDYNGALICILAADEELEQYLNIVNSFDFTI